MTEKYWRAWIKYTDGYEELIDAFDYRVEIVESEDFYYSYDRWTPKPPTRLLYKNSHGGKVEIELPPDATILTRYIEGDIWWLEIKGFRSSDYYDDLSSAIANQKEDEEIKGGFITTVNPNK
ncbi:hypothetical protein SEA_WEASELS2_47 [Rhodococcus phage Weasels2]|uniref:Uncharacterized protein n=1 Tax=Rhodococcus phage Weasels2 TaxID=1897437 RepID=A0A1I9SA31_9CAUD|nr:hypothetical protein FDH04_gp047 [Rhodococcus phage Weasels2]AOZ63637.1 hypothetical protein SEA_WEASELS2_47 [Rhodococcus phage Weasels2]